MDNCPFEITKERWRKRLKILIVDDELLERKAMRKMLSSYHQEIEIVGEAENGRKAVELAGQLQPNIIFMDIKMPGMTGLEASRMICEMHPHIKIILVSAYDTFAYAKQAIQYGIKDYILKPGRKSEILSTLNRMIEEVQKDQKKDESEKETTSILKESVVFNMIRRQVDEKTETLLAYFYPKLQHCYFIVFSKGRHMTEASLKKALNQLLVEKFIVVKVKNAFVVLVIEEKNIEKADQLITAKKLSIVLGKDTYLGLGTLFTEIDEASLSYERAYAACFYYKANEKSHYGFFSNVESKTKEELMARIVQEVENGHEDMAKELFKQFALETSKADRDRLYIQLQTSLEKHQLIPVEMPISTLYTDEDWSTFLQLVCMKMSTYNQSKHTMEVAKQYIEKHFTKPLTLEEVALEVKLSPTYFSKIFKEYFRATFIEYVTKIRMEEARKLIQENEISLKEISFLIGYNDPNYFSRVFKKHYGDSPRQFQSHILKK